MSSGLAFWGPFILIFSAGLIISVIQRYARDICLMRFDSDHVLIQMKNGQWIWGRLEVHSKALEVIYTRPVSARSGNEYLSHVLYEQNIAEIILMLRPEPATDSPAYRKWQREMRRLRHPPLFRRIFRALRNSFNMLRNAFSESIAAAIGLVRQRTTVGKLAGADQKATEVGQKLLTTIPASYEPILEHYRSHEVGVETFKDPANPGAGLTERIGVFEEYSDKFIVLRDVRITDDLPREALREEDACDHFADDLVCAPSGTAAGTSGNPQRPCFARRRVIAKMVFARRFFP